MKRVFLNWKGPQGRETVDELDRADFADNKAFRAELNRLCSEYSMAGMAVYSSSRACANWKDTESEQ
jgi:hypothetical protein